jgi:acyl carrier protein
MPEPTDFETVRELVALTFGLPPDAVTAETSRETCPKWDSLAHLNLMLALEDAFHLTLTVDDIQRLGSVAAILAHVQGSR